MFNFRAFLFCLIVFVCSISMQAQPRVFIASMDEGFDSFLAAALLDNKVPISITTDECAANYVITGQAVKGQNKWYDTVFGAERDRNQGSIKLLKVSDRTIVWAGAAGDRSIWWGALKSGGQKKVANRLARELKKEFFNKVMPAEDVSGPCTPNTNHNEQSVAVKSTKASLQITSTPEGAEVIINGKTVGITPISLEVDRGEKTIVLRKSGFKKWEKFVRLAPGESLILDASL